MIDLRQRPAFLEEALHAVPERGEVLRGAGAHNVAFGAQHQRRGQIFLDRDRPAAVIERPIDDREPAAADLAINAVVQQLIPGGQGLVGDAHRRSRSKFRSARTCVWD